MTPEAERWTRAAFVTPVLMLLVLVTSALRPGAPLGPIVYAAGLPLVGTLALLQILHGLVSSLRRPPIVRPARLRAFLILAATAFMAVLPIPYSSSYADRPSALTFALPVQGAWEVVLGGDRPFSNTLVLSPQLRYALVLSRAPERGGAPSEAAFGAPLHAPADARVIEVEGRLPDDAGRAGTRITGAEGASGDTTGPPEHPAGNRIVLEVRAGEYLFLVGLQQGSPTVAVGDLVVRGQLVGRVGTSGRRVSGSAAHLMFHLQDRPGWGRGEAIPWRFGPYEVQRSGAGRGAAEPVWEREERGRPGLGDRIRTVTVPGSEAPDRDLERIGD